MSSVNLFSKYQLGVKKNQYLCAAKNFDRTSAKMFVLQLNQ